MKRTQLLVIFGAAVSVFFLGGRAFAQTAPTSPQSPVPSQPSAQAPQTSSQANCQKSADRIDGTVESIDTQQGKLNVRGSNGQMYSFNAAKDTLQSYKVGDHIQAKLRSNPKC